MNEGEKKKEEDDEYAMRQSQHLHIRSTLIERGEISIHCRIANSDALFERIELSKRGACVKCALGSFVALCSHLNDAFDLVA